MGRKKNIVNKQNLFVTEERNDPWVGLQVLQLVIVEQSTVDIT